MKHPMMPKPFVTQGGSSTSSDSSESDSSSSCAEEGERSNEASSCSSGAHILDDVEMPEIFSDCDPDNLPSLDTDTQEAYPNSSLTTVKVLAILFSWFAAYPGISKEALSHLLFILHNFILPPGNNLPLSYEAARSKIKSFLVKPIEYHCCLNNCIIYRDRYENLLECPSCGTERYTGKGTQPQKRFRYIPILPRLKRLYSVPKLAKLMQQHLNVEKDAVCDIHHSSAWKALYSA